MTLLKYYIVDVDNIKDINWDTTIEKSIDNCRWNKSKTEIIVKSFKVPRWYTNKPIYNIYSIKKHITNSIYW